MSQPSNPLQNAFAGIELLEIRLVVRTANLYDSYRVWRNQGEILEALKLGDMISQKQPYLDMVVDQEFIDTTERFNP
jgi:hypothetical protein